MIDMARLKAQRRRNLLLTLLLLAGLAAWMAAVGWLVAGPVGVLWALLGAALVMLLRPAWSLSMVKRAFGGITLYPDDAPELHDLVLQLSERAGLRRPPVLLFLPRAEPLALSSGRQQSSAIALSAGLLTRLGVREMAAVLAHEISHIRGNDLGLLLVADAVGRLTRGLAMAGVLLLGFLLPHNLINGVPMPWLLLILLLVAPLVSDLLVLTLSRAREYEADAAAVELTGDPDGLMAALGSLGEFEQAAGAAWNRPVRRRWLRWLTTHPPLQDRIRRLAELKPPHPPIRFPGVVLRDGLYHELARRHRPRRWL